MRACEQAFVHLRLSSNSRPIENTRTQKQTRKKTCSACAARCRLQSSAPHTDHKHKQHRETVVNNEFGPQNARKQRSGPRETRPPPRRQRCAHNTPRWHGASSRRLRGSGSRSHTRRTLVASASAHCAHGGRGHSAAARVRTLTQACGGAASCSSGCACRARTAVWRVRASVVCRVRHNTTPSMLSVGTRCANRAATHAGHVTPRAAHVQPAPQPTGIEPRQQSAGRLARAAAHLRRRHASSARNAHHTQLTERSASNRSTAFRPYLVDCS